MAIYYVCRKYEVFLNELIFQHFSIVCIDDDWKSYIKTKLLSLKYVESNTKIDMDQTSDAEKKEVLKTCKDIKVLAEEESSSGYFMWCNEGNGQTQTIKQSSNYLLIRCT